MYQAFRRDLILAAGRYGFTRTWCKSILRAL